MLRPAALSRLRTGRAAGHQPALSAPHLTRCGSRSPV
jgi:hypothetical protein